MRIFILTLGTRGDFELFFVLAKELRQRGHDVVLGSPDFYAPRAQGASLEWKKMGAGSLSDLLVVLKSMANVSDKVQRTYLFYHNWLRPQLAAASDKIVASAADADYFVSNLKILLERNGKTIPTAFVTYDVPRSLADLSKYGSKRTPGAVLELVAMNKQLVDPQNCWGPEYHFTGFWGERELVHWKPTHSVNDFLAVGSPPVVVTMGSMALLESSRFFEFVSEAIRLAGHRGILLGSWMQFQEKSSTPEIIQLQEIPYDWLFPRAACVIHHGGCGTVAAALRAAKPSVLVPQISCQEDMAKCLVREKLACGIVDLASMDCSALSRFIQAAASERKFRLSAERWKEVLAVDGGVAAAADLIEKHWALIRGSKL